MELLKFHEKYLKYLSCSKFCEVDSNYIVYATKVAFDALVCLDKVSVLGGVEENESSYNYGLVPASH